MKQLLFIPITLIAICSLFFFSCKKDKNQKDEIQLVSGKWYLETEDGVEVSACEKKSSVEFTNDGRWVFQVYIEYDTDCESINGEGTYTLNGNNITITLGTESSIGTFSISGGILTVQAYNEDLGRTETSTYDKTSG